MNKICFNFIRSALAIASIALIVNCEGGDLEYNYPQSGPRGLPTYEKQESIFGEGGLTLFGGGPGAPEARPGGGAGVGVNSFLWRASLDTVSFMPLQSADPFGGVIITDWYAPRTMGGSVSRSTFSSWIGRYARTVCEPRSLNNNVGSTAAGLTPALMRSSIVRLRMQSLRGRGR